MLDLSIGPVDVERVILDGAVVAGIYSLWYGTSWEDGAIAGAQAAGAQVVSEVALGEISILPDFLESFQEVLGVDILAAVIFGLIRTFVYGGGFNLEDFFRGALISMIANLAGYYGEQMLNHPSIVGVEKSIKSEQKKDKKKSEKRKKKQRKVRETASTILQQDQPAALEAMESLESESVAW